MSKKRRIKGKCYIIAEAGSNHDGKLEQAFSLIDAAAEAGADAIKFQIFKAKTMYPRRDIKVEYLKNIGIDKNLYDIIKDLEVPYSWVEKLYKHAKKKKIDFMATPFDVSAVKMLDKYVDVYKIASYEALYGDLLRSVVKTGKPVFISTGACKEKEIDDLLRRTLSGYLDKVTLLHCIAKYPAPLNQIILNTLPHMSNKYDISVGFSDHTAHPYIAPVVAVGLGAVAIEKHFTLSKKLPGPDHSFALDPDELGLMVKNIRLAEKVLGKENKRKLQPCEEELYYYKRCLYLKNDLKKGQKLQKKHIEILRNTGEKCGYFNPEEICQVLGKVLIKDKKRHEVLRRGDLSEKRV